MTLVWLLAVLAGFSLSILSSRQTLDAAVSLARQLGLSSFIIGLTVVAIGTDLPEIANSISASATDHGDINVGDSIGSVVTQGTLILGILLFVKKMNAERKSIAVSGSVTVIALLIGAIVLGDEYLSRTDGLLLISVWMLGTMAVQLSGHVVSARQETLFTRSVLSTLRDLSVGLGGVALGAMVAVKGFTEVAAALNMPEYATSFLLLSIGTSLPELIVNLRALRGGEGSLAMGGMVGSLFVDATLSLGIGPALFPVAVSSATQTGNFLAAAIVAGAIALLLTAREHGRRTGVILIGLYAVAYLVLIA